MLSNCAVSAFHSPFQNLSFLIHKRQNISTHLLVLQIYTLLIQIYTVLYSYTLELDMEQQTGSK